MMNRRSVILIAILVSSVFLLLFESSICDAKSLKPLSELRVFDANGKRVGTVISAGPPAAYPRLAFKVDGFLVTFFVNRVTFFGDQDHVFFESTNCSGTPFLRVLSTFLIFPDVQIAQPGSTVYLADPDGISEVITAKSILPASDGSAPPGPCTAISETTLTATPSIALIDLNMLFTPPFSVRGISAHNRRDHDDHDH